MRPLAHTVRSVSESFRVPSDASRPFRAPEGEAGCRGLAFLVTFAAIGKSDWPRAAMERAGCKRICCSSRPFDRLRANGEVANNLPQSTAPSP